MSRDIMARAEDYERYAEHCLKMAEIADSPEDRVIRREMATEWLKLAADLRKAKAYPRNWSTTSARTMITARTRSRNRTR